MATPEAQLSAIAALENKLPAIETALNNHSTLIQAQNTQLAVLAQTTEALTTRVATLESKESYVPTPGNDRKRQACHVPTTYSPAHQFHIRQHAAGITIPFRMKLRAGAQRGVGEEVGDKEVETGKNDEKTDKKDSFVGQLAEAGRGCSAKAEGMLPKSPPLSSSLSSPARLGQPVSPSQSPSQSVSEDGGKGDDKGSSSGTPIHPDDESSDEALAEIFVRIPDGRTIMLNVDVDANTIGNVKMMLQGTEGIPINRQRLVFANKTLGDGRTLANYNINNKSTIDLVRAYAKAKTRKRKGGADADADAEWRWIVECLSGADGEC